MLFGGSIKQSKRKKARHQLPNETCAWPTNPAAEDAAMPDHRTALHECLIALGHTPQDHPRVAGVLTATSKPPRICYCGAFIDSGFLLPSPGAHIEVDVYLPPLSPTARSVQLHGEGRVLRVNPAGTDPPGFAAEVLFHTESSDAAFILG